MALVSCTECGNVWDLFLDGDGGGNSTRRGSMSDQYHWNDERINIDFFGFLSPADEERSVEEDERSEEGDGGR